MLHVMPVSEHNVPTTPRNVPCRTCTDFKSWAREQRTMMSDAPAVNNAENIVSQQVIAGRNCEIVYRDCLQCNHKSKFIILENVHWQYE